MEGRNWCGGGQHFAGRSSNIVDNDLPGATDTGTGPDFDMSVWLSNKLGPLGTEWTSRNIVPYMNQAALDHVNDSFASLHEDIKIKFLLAILYFPKPKLEQNKDVLKEIIEQGLEDVFPRVTLMSEIMKEYPKSGQLNTKAFIGDHFEQILKDFDEEIFPFLKGIEPSNSSCGVLPLEYAYLNPGILAIELKGNLVGTPSRYPEDIFPKKHQHFVQRKPHKATELREALLNKSAFLTSKRGLFSSKSGSSTGQGPQAVCDPTVKQKLQDTSPEAPLKWLPCMYNPNTSQKRGAAILLDICQQPAPKMRRVSKIKAVLPSAKSKQTSAVSSPMISSESIGTSQDGPFLSIPAAADLQPHQDVPVNHTAAITTAPIETNPKYSETTRIANKFENSKPTKSVANESDFEAIFLLEHYSPHESSILKRSYPAFRKGTVKSKIENDSKGKIVESESSARTGFEMLSQLAKTASEEAAANTMYLADNFNPAKISTFVEYCSGTSLPF